MTARTGLGAPCRRTGAGVVRWTGAWLWLCTILAVAALPAHASGRVPAPLAVPVLGASGSVVVLTDPPGARIWVGDRFLGTTPARIDSLAPGRVQVIVAPSPSLARWRRPCLLYAEVRAGALDTLRIDLRGASADAFGRGGSVTAGLPLGAAPGTEAAAARKTRGAAKWTGGHSLLPRLGTALPIAALGLGAAGAWVRHSADAAYRDYLRTVDRGPMEDRFRRAQRLDRVSVACWIGAEACLAGAAWVWLGRDVPVPVAASFDDDGVVRLGLRMGGGTAPDPAREGER